MIQEKIQFCGNVWVRLMHFPHAGSGNEGHSHLFNHTTLLANGKVKVTVNGKETEFTAPHLIFINAKDKHQITALEPDTVICCIHAIRDGDEIEDIVAEDAVPLGVRHPQMKPLVTTLRVDASVTQR